jgi:hypothetical protein
MPCLWSTPPRRRFRSRARPDDGSARRLGAALPGCAVLLLLCSALRAEVYQYAAPVRTVDGKDATAFLWVPPEADRLRGALVGGQILMEQPFACDPQIRKACAEEKLAIVFFSPPIDAVFDYRNRNSGGLLEKALDDLAELSGYRELAKAPLFPFGHSVSSLFATRVVYWSPGRCFGALPFKGGLPSSDDPNATLAGVPILVIKGQFEEFGPGPSGVLRDFEDREAAWKGMREIIAGLREKDERHLIAYLVEPGASHFAWSERTAPYAARFIRMCARQRIPDWPADAAGPVRCNAVDPATGARTSAAVGQEALAATAGEFTGDRKRNFWHFDAELAKRADTLHEGLAGKRPQFVTFADAGTGRPVFVGHDLRLKLSPTWVGPDTFKVAGVFLDKAPDKYPQVEGQVGHAAGAVTFRLFAGTAVQTAADTFRVAPDGRGRIRAEVLAFHPGDATYRYAEQQGRVTVPDKLMSGRGQKITFPPVETMQAGGAGVKLAATSDAGLPVRYYVESGPAVVEGDMLKPAEIPARAKWPMRISVVAYQYGSAIEPLVQSAESARQVIRLEP